MKSFCFPVASALLCSCFSTVKLPFARTKASLTDKCKRWLQPFEHAVMLAVLSLLFLGASISRASEKRVIPNPPSGRVIGTSCNGQGVTFSDPVSGSGGHIYGNARYVFTPSGGSVTGPGITANSEAFEGTFSTPQTRISFKLTAVCVGFHNNIGPDPTNNVFLAAFSGPKGTGTFLGGGDPLIADLSITVLVGIEAFNGVAVRAQALKAGFQS